MGTSKTGQACSRRSLHPPELEDIGGMDTRVSRACPAGLEVLSTFKTKTWLESLDNVFAACGFKAFWHAPSNLSTYVSAPTQYPPQCCSSRCFGLNERSCSPFWFQPFSAFNSKIGLGSLSAPITGSIAPTSYHHPALSTPNSDVPSGYIYRGPGNGHASAQ